MALSRPSPASLVTLLKLSLLLLVPAFLSTHVIMAKLYTEIIGAVGDDICQTLFISDSLEFCNNISNINLHYKHSSIADISSFHEIHCNKFDLNCIHLFVVIFVINKAHPCCSQDG